MKTEERTQNLNLQGNGLRQTKKNSKIMIYILTLFTIFKRDLEPKKIIYPLCKMKRNMKISQKKISKAWLKMNFLNIFLV